MSVETILGLFDRLSGSGSLTSFSLGAICALAGIGWLAYKTLPLLRDIKAQLVPNGGSSLHDKVNSINRRTLIDNRLMREVIDNLGLYRWVSDRDGRYLYVSDSYSRLAGISASGLIGNEWKRTIHQDDRVRVLLEWTRSIKDGSSFLMNYRIVDTRGKESRVAAEAEAVRDEGGAIVAYVGKITPMEN